MTWENSISLKIIFSLFFFNSLSIYFYCSSPENRRDPPPKRAGEFDADHPKPWPTLPSYLPWSHRNTQVALDSCEAYFGNGFSQRLDLLRPVAAGSGWFRCLFSETLQSSICEGGRVRMVPERIRVSRGGERLEEVVGRDEEEELPEFEDGAFEVDGGEEEKKKLVGEEFLDDYLPQGEVLRHTMRALIGSIRVVETSGFGCEEVSGLRSQHFWSHALNGHCTTQLEETWKTLFSGVRYAKDFSCPVCFRHAIISPLGYETAFFKGLTEELDCVGAFPHDPQPTLDSHRTARLSEFGEMITASFGLPVGTHHARNQVSGHNILFVRREDYVAHPRHGGRVQTRLSNEQEVFDSLKSWASEQMECRVNLIDGVLAHMAMKEQVRAIQDASVIIGAHGAGLTHIVSATPNTVILEIVSADFKRPHFRYIARWKGLEYHAINLEESNAETGDVVDKLSSIMKSFGC